VSHLIQDILPQYMNIDFKNRTAMASDFVIIIEGSNIVIQKHEDGHIEFPSYTEIANTMKVTSDELMYLFAVDEEHYYLYIGQNLCPLDMAYTHINKRDLFNDYSEVYGFIGYTSGHINDWYLSNKYCGKCGRKMNLKAGERTISCISCDMVKYPQINPVVIVGIHDGDKLLLTKYANSNYDRYALVAGFVEVGESFEDTVRREVMEEVGLKVKNITYFASQPWGISGGLMAGYFAELDGDNTIRLDLEELKEGTWITKDKMPEVYENEKSLTRTMMYDWYNRQSK